MRVASLKRVIDRVSSLLRGLQPDAYRWVAWLGVVTLLTLCVVVDDDVGITMDEADLARYGRRILMWYSSGFHHEFDLLSNTVQAQYGGLFAALVTAANHWLPFDEYVIRHFFSSVCGVLGIIAAWKIAGLLGGQRAGLCAALLLVFTPAWIGHALFNPKDTPFAAGVAWAVYYTLRIARGEFPPRLRDCLGYGLAAGAALGVRPGGMFVLIYPVFALSARLWFEHTYGAGVRSCWLQASISVLAGLSLAWCIMLVAWPWGLFSPLFRPFRAAAIAAHFAWGGRMLFRGAYVSANALPLAYLPTWFAITLPEAYPLAIACAMPLIWIALRRPAITLHRLAVLTLLVTTAGPFSMALIARPVIYDAHRHFLFLLPLLAAGCGYAFGEFFGALSLPKLVRNVVIVGFAALCLLTARDIALLHPYEYVYFNHSVGGLQGAATRYETDYWGASYKEGLSWVVANLRPTRFNQPVRVATCSDLDETIYYLAHEPALRGRFQFTRDAAKADALLSIPRDECYKRAGTVLHKVERMGVPLLYVLRPVRRKAS